MRESIARIRALIMDPPSASVPLERRIAYPLWLVRLSLQLGKQWALDRCPQIAASLAFQTALTLVPIFAVISALMDAAGAFSAQSALVRYLSENVFPAIGADLFEHLMSFVQNVRRGALGPFGLAITLLLGYTVFHSVEKVFGQIWRVERGRSLWSKFIVFYMLATLVPLLLGLSLYSTARYWRGGSGALVPFLSIWLALALANKLLPRTHVRWRAAVAGATVSALLFEGAKHVFATYLTQVALARYRGVYGTVAVIPITLVWMYVGWLVILFGAECAHAAQNLKLLEALDRRARSEGGEPPGITALRICLEVARAFATGAPPPSPQLLAARLDLDEDVLERVLCRLKMNDIVRELAVEPPTLVPARPPDRIALEEVLGLFPTAPARLLAGASCLDALLAEIERARRARVGDLQIADLLDAPDRAAAAAPVVG